MAKKDALFGKLLYNDIDLSSSYTPTEYFRIKYLDNLTIIIETSGVSDNTGTFYVYHRIVKDDDLRAHSEWTLLDFGENITLSGDGSDKFRLDINQITPGELRVTFTPEGTSPAGSADIWICGSGLGG